MNIQLLCETQTLKNPTALLKRNVSLENKKEDRT